MRRTEKNYQRIEIHVFECLEPDLFNKGYVALETPVEVKPIEPFNEEYYFISPHSFIFVKSKEIISYPSPCDIEFVLNHEFAVRGLTAQAMFGDMVNYEDKSRRHIGPILVHLSNNTSATMRIRKDDLLGYIFLGKTPQ